MRILTWNVAKRRDSAGQTEAIFGLAPDVVVLQEVTGHTWPRLREGLAQQGLVHAATATELNNGGAATRRLPCFVTISSRWPVTPSGGPAVPAPETLACARVCSPGGTFAIVGVHIPTGVPKNATVRVETQEALLRRLLSSNGPTIVCGDFNSPRAEHPDGTVVPFAGGRNTRARAAEIALSGPVTSAGLVDLYRHVHGFGVDAWSWCWKNRGAAGGFRIDHMFASPSVRVLACEYAHAWREARLSDHSALWADVELSVSERRPIAVDYRFSAIHRPFV